MSRPRILFVCHGHPELTPGGTEIMTHDLCHALHKAGYADTQYLGCVTRLHRAFRPESRLERIRLTPLEMLMWVGSYDPFAMAQPNLDSFVQAMRAVLAEARPDIVHFHHLSLMGLEGLMVVRRLLPKVRIVVTLHDYANLCFNDGLLIRTTSGSLCFGPTPFDCHNCFPDISPGRFLIRSLHIKTMLGLVDHFIAPSHFLRKRFLEWGLPPERIEVIANAVPQNREKGRGNIFNTASRGRFGFFGNIAPHKGILVALAATRQLADAPVSLAIHGGIHFQSESFNVAFAEAVAASPQSVSWHGIYARNDIAQLMADVAWIIVPSTWWENAPLVILEAFRNQRPVICSDIGGMAEMVEDGVSGLHFRAGDAADLARTMRRAATERGLLEKLQGGLPDVPQPSEAAAAHARLYRALLNKDDVNPPPPTLEEAAQRHPRAALAETAKASCNWDKRNEGLKSNKRCGCRKHQPLAVE